MAPIKSWKDYFRDGPVSLYQELVTVSHFACDPVVEADGVPHDDCLGRTQRL